MQPNWFVDIEVRGAGNQLAAHSIALPVMTRLLYILHGIFKSYDPERGMIQANNHEMVKETHNPYAIALPFMKEGSDQFTAYPGHVIRVFASNETLLKDLIEQLRPDENSPQTEISRRLLGYIGINATKQVDVTDQSGNWLAYRRFRIPNKKSVFTGARAKRLEEAKQWPYFCLKSQSQQTIFSLHVEKIPIDKNQRAAYAEDDFYPDYYGLSSKQRIVYLPDIKNKKKDDNVTFA